MNECEGLHFQIEMRCNKLRFFSHRVQKCSEINHMNAHNLALVFSSCLFQTKGQTSEEVNVIEDLINNYVEIFEVNILNPSLVKIVLMSLFANKNMYFRIFYSGLYEYLKK